MTANIMFEVHDYGDVQLELMLVGDGGPLTVLLPGAGGGVRGYRALAPLLGNDNSIWPHRDDEFWPHPAVVIRSQLHLPS